MKQIKVKPVQVESLRVSPILVTSTSVESIHVSGESGEIVDTRPMWIEVNRVVQSEECQKNYQNENTGTLVTWYAVTYENQNENSSTYGNTKVEYLRVDTYDTTACPLFVEPEIYSNAAVDYDGNYYDAVIVGDQVWLTSNLKATHCSDGTALTKRNVGYKVSGGGSWATGYLKNDDCVYYGPNTFVEHGAIENWMVPKYSDFSALVQNSNITVKDITSDSGWQSNYVVGSPGNHQEENNTTLLNFQPFGVYAALSGDVIFMGEICQLLCSDPAISDGRKVGLIASNSTTMHSDYVREHLCTVRLIYDGTVEQFLASYRDLTVPDRGLYPNAVQDYDGNYYDAVILGNQVWLGSNLRTTHYADGTEVNSNDYTTPMEDENTVADISKYGLLYNFNAVMNGASSSHTVPSGVQGIAPNGWHIPSHDEILVMTSWVGLQNDFAYNAPSNIAKALASKEGWFSSGGYIAGSPGSIPSENNATQLNVYPNYNDAPVPLVSYGARLITCTQQDTYSGDDDYLRYYRFGFSFNYATCSLNAAYGYLSIPCGVRCLYNGTVSEFLENYVDLNPSNS